MPTASTDLMPADQLPQSCTDPATLHAPAMPCLTHPSPRRAAAIIALAWLPALIVAAGLPRFVPVFERWHWELSTLTLALMSVGRLGTWPIVLAGVGMVAILVGLYAGWVRAGLSGQRAVAVAFAVAGVGVFAVCILGTLVPIFTAPVGR
jgi:hypothetical protein